MVNYIFESDDSGYMATISTCKARIADLERQVKAAWLEALEAEKEAEPCNAEGE